MSSLDLPVEGDSNEVCSDEIPRLRRLRAGCALSLPHAPADASQGQAAAQPAPANDPIRIAAVQGRYARKGKPSDFIELNADGTCGLRQDGYSVHGNYTLQGDRITFTSPEMPELTTYGHLAGDTIKDDDGIIWEKMTEEQRAAAPPMPQQSADLESAVSVVGKYVAKGVAYYLQLNPDETVSCGNLDGSAPRNDCGSYKLLGPGVRLTVANNRPTNMKIVGNTLVGKTQIWEREVILTNKEVMKLIALDLGDEIVIAKIKNAPKVTLDVSTDALLALKTAKVSSSVVAAMIERAGQSDRSSATASPSVSAPTAPPVSAAAVSPSGQEFLGKWSVTKTCWTGSRSVCVFEISKNGSSFVIKNVGDTCSTCADGAGIYTLTPEGNLEGGPLSGIVLSFDRTTNQIIRGAGSELDYLSRKQ